MCIRLFVKLRISGHIKVPIQSAKSQHHLKPLIPIHPSITSWGPFKPNFIQLGSLSPHIFLFLQIVLCPLSVHPITQGPHRLWGPLAIHFIIFDQLLKPHFPRQLWPRIHAPHKSNGIEFFDSFGSQGFTCEFLPRWNLLKLDPLLEVIDLLFPYSAYPITKHWILLVSLGHQTITILFLVLHQPLKHFIKVGENSVASILSPTDNLALPLPTTTFWFPRQFSCRHKLIQCI
mmetsp:Transcript_14325/g.26045  ORF Transcript_14325/g.26045 Transcript_14325/m.26045 type:complete len:232 (+) Transcript_14325:301-996(+)